MKSKFILPLLAILLAIGTAMATHVEGSTTNKWGVHSELGCQDAALINPENCGTQQSTPNRCMVDFGDEIVPAFDVDDCESQPLYEQQ